MESEQITRLNSVLTSLDAADALLEAIHTEMENDWINDDESTLSSELGTLDDALASLRRSIVALSRISA